MMFYYLLTQTCTVDVGIYFGCRDTLVTEHCLYHTEVCTALEQMGGKGVAEGVRADTFLYTGHHNQLLDEMEHHNT